MRSYMARWITALLLIGMTMAPAEAAGFKWSDIFGGASKDAYSFKWVDRAGKAHSLAEYKGKALILHFWASWCRPCKEEMSAMTEWVRAHPDVIFLPVSLDKNIRDAEHFLKSRDIDFPALLTDEAQARGVGAASLPTTMVIDAEGSVQQNHRGSRDWGNRAFSAQLLEGLSSTLPSGQLERAEHDMKRENSESHEHGH